MSKKFVRLTCVFAWGGAALFAQTVFAQTLVPQVVETTGMVGLAENQTARLNLLNPGVLPPAIGMVCSATVSFIDGAGTVLKSAAITINPGTSSGLNLDSEVDLSVAYGARREIRAVITLPATILPPVPVSVTTPGAATTTTSIPLAVCKLIPTLEIFDSVTGRTLVTLGRVVAVPAVVAPATN